MKKLGFGLMRLPLKDADDRSSIDQKQMNQMVDRFLSKGFTYFDTAYPYHNGKSEIAFKKAVVERYPREQFTITDKMPTWMITSNADLQKYFDEQLDRCGVEYFDYYWLHTIGSANYELATKFGGFEFLQKMKAEGKIKHIGFSFHDKATLLDEILSAHPETEYVQLQINYIDWDNENIESRKCYEVATKHHKPVIVMEPIKGGILAKVAPAAEKIFKDYHPEMSIASWAIRYVASLDNVFMVLSGMSDIEQLNDNTSYMQNFKPFNIEEHEIMTKVTNIINSSITIPCTACHYCTENCPMHIAIPECFSLYNAWQQFGPTMTNRVYYENLTEKHGKASVCIECHQCEEHCPQHINITENLKEVARLFG
jgi:uncharacterized protein